MAEWLYEQGIGENRAILVEDDRIIEAAIELPSATRVGHVREGRLTTILIAARRGLVTLADGTEVLLEPLPRHLTEGQAVRVEVVREPLWDGRVAKRAKARVSEAPPGDGPSLLDRLRGSGEVRQVLTSGPDLFEQAGWSELLEQAQTGDIGFEGGTLLLALTPAMTIIDVDGFLPPNDLAMAAAAAAGRTIRQFGIGGSIGIDLPTLASRTDRQAVAAALDRELPQPFERTAVNGFGFLQIVRRRERASLPELLQEDPCGAAARALLRRAERVAGAGPRTLAAAPAVAARIGPNWRQELERRVGAPVVLRPDPALAISEWHVQAAHN